MSFFVISKFLRPLLNPLHILLVLALLGTLLALTKGERLRKFGLRLTLLAIIMLLAIGLLPVGDYWLHQTESAVPRAALPARVDGIMVLGGIIRSQLYADHHEPVISEHPDRVRAFLELSRQYPQAKLLFTGGSSRMLGQMGSEAPAFAVLWAKMGGDPKRLMLEDKARNTLENVTNSYHLIQPKPGENWVLVTSAYHMPRALTEFQRIGWPVLPYPCDYQTASDPWANYQPIIALNWLRFNSAWTEWLGGLAYRWHGD